MDYILREKWVEVCQMFFEAYVKFRLEGTDAHWFELNNRNIEIAFFDNGDFLTVKLNCPEVLKCLIGYYNNSAQDTEEILKMLLWLAFDAEGPYTYEIETSDSEKAYQQIKKILKDMDNQITDYYDENYFTMDAGVDLECIIKICNRQIKVTARFNDIAWRTAFLLECITTGRSSDIYDTYNTSCWEDVARRIQYFALEPECFKITTTDSEWESELIRTIVVEAIAACSTEEEREERIIELHNRQIIIQLQDNRQSLDVFLDCVTTGRSSSCVVEHSADNPEELICKIQELAWENV